MIKVQKWGGSWCESCKTLSKILQEKDIEEVDVEENMDEARKLNIRHLPVTIFFKDGEAVERITGLFSAEKFDEIIEKYS
jgi:thioredoxin 1